jgi:hypothetical protein
MKITLENGLITIECNGASWSMPFEQFVLHARDPLFHGAIRLPEFKEALKKKQHLEISLPDAPARPIETERLDAATLPPPMTVRGALKMAWKRLRGNNGKSSF